MRTGLTNSLVTIEAEPVRPAAERDEKGLKLGERLGMLKTALDDLSGQDFWERSTREQAVFSGAPDVAGGIDRSHDGAVRFVRPVSRRSVCGLRVRRSGASCGRSQRRRRPGAVHEIEFRRDPGRGAAIRVAADDGGVAPGRCWRSSAGSVRSSSRPRAVCARAGDGLGAEATDALQRLEREAAVHHPYVFARQSDFLVSAWTDTQSGSPAPAEGLKRWAGFVDEQRDSLRRYAAQAEPLVHFLTTARAAPALTRRWAGIVEDVSNYDQKLAGNGLGALDTFLRDVVPVLVPERDCGAGGAVVTARSAGFLGTVRNELFEDTLKRCRDLARSRQAATPLSPDPQPAPRGQISVRARTSTARGSGGGRRRRVPAPLRSAGRRRALQQIQAARGDMPRVLSRPDALYRCVAAREL